MNTWRDLGPLFIGDGEYLILSYLAKIRETFELSYLILSYLAKIREMFEFESWLGALVGWFRAFWKGEAGRTQGTGFGDHSGYRIRGPDP